MKCLSLWQPWASLLVHGKKQVETRSWPIVHRGPLLIHAAKKWDDDQEAIASREPFLSALRSVGLFPWHERSHSKGLPFGCIVGRVEVKGCYPTEDVILDDDLATLSDGLRLVICSTERAFGDYAPGRFAFLCSDAVSFPEPIPYRGMQGMFNVSDGILPLPV